MRDLPMLLLEMGPDGPDALHVSARDGRSTDLGPARWRGRHGFDRAAVVREVAGLESARRTAITRPGRALDKVRAHGQLLFDLLLPPPVKAALRRASGALLLDGGPADIDVPWALLHDGDDFLGCRLALGEGRAVDAWPTLREAPGARTLVMADPASDLPAARVEGEALAAVFGQAARPPAYDLRLGRTTRSEALRALRRYAVVHVAGHVDPASDGHGGGFRLADGWLEPAAIALLAGGAMPRLVFANACRSMGPVADALLAAGVRHLVGSDLDLPDLPGADFARDVHRLLVRGVPVGEALRRARVQAADRGDPVWVAYRLRGDPRTAFAEEVEATRQTELRRAVALAVRRAAPSAGDLETRLDGLHRWRRRVEGAVGPAGGALLPAAGLVCRAVFGLTTRREDDLRRAAAAALSIARATPDAVVTVDEGRLAVVGDAVLGGPLDRVETACWQRGPGVWLSADAADALRDAARFDLDDRQRLLELGRREVATGPFIGRGAELDRLYRAADEVVETGRGVTLTVVGPAGIGKSRLVAAARDRLEQRFRVVSVSGDAAGPYGGVAELVRALARVDGAARPDEARRALRDLLGSTAEPDDFLSIDDLLGDRRDETGDRHTETLLAILGLGDAPDDPTVEPTVAPAVKALVEAVARQQPIVLVIEDLHHAPRPAAAVVEALVGDPPSALVVVTTRPGGPAADRPAGAGHHRLELAPLSARAARALVGALAPGAGPDTLDQLLARAEGNPLFIHELTRADAAADALPATVEAVMQGRIDRLDDADRVLLRAAAVLGRVFWLEGVERLAGRTGVRTAFERLATARFVVPEPRSDLPGMTQWRFEHGLLHAVVERSIPRHAGAALHGRAALWLSDEVGGDPAPRAARIARHRQASGDRARAVADWIAAADHAEATLASEEARLALAAAVALQGQMIDAGMDVPASHRAALQARLGELDRIAGDLDRAAERLAAAVADTPPDTPADRAWRLGRVSMVALDRGAVPAAQAAIDEALTLLDGAPARVRADVVHHAAWLDYHQGVPARAEARLRRLLDALPDDARRERSMAWVLLGSIAQQRGDADAATAWFRRALANLRGDHARVKVLHGLALVAIQRKAWDEAARHYAESIRIRARLGDRAGLAKTYSNLGTLYGERGDFGRAERYLREAIRIRAGIGHALLAISHANLVELYLRQGRRDDAAAELDRVTALLDAGEAPGWARGELWRMTADVRLRHGDLAAARAAADKAVEVSRAMGDRPREAGGLAVRARVATADGRVDAAAAALEAAIEIWEELEDLEALATDLEALAELVAESDPSRAAEARRHAGYIRDDAG